MQRTSHLLLFLVALAIPILQAFSILPCRVFLRNAVEVIVFIVE
jgi:hypothetical protein